MKIKNLLLTTTAFMTVLCMQGAFAHSNMKKSGLKPKVHAHSPLHINLWGWLDAQAGFRSQPNKYLKNADGDKAGVSINNKNLAFDTEGLLRAEVKGKTSKGLKYGANIDLTVDLNTHRDTSGTSHNDQNQNNNFAKMNRTYIYMQDRDMGRLEMGNKDGAAGTMLPTADCVAAATGGIGGDWSKYVVINPVPATNTIIESSFHMNAGSLLDQSGTLPAFTPIQKPRKLTYYTPEHSSGLQFGISYVPDASNVKDIFRNEAVQSANTLGYKDGVSAGITWKYRMNKSNMTKIGLVGEYATVQKQAKSNYKKLGSVGIGISHMYKDFSAAASFNYLGRSGLRKSTTLKSNKDNYVATAGLAYDIDKKTKISLTGLMSRKWKNKFYNASLGAQYMLAPGLMPYAEVSLFEMKQKYSYVGQTNPLDVTLTGTGGATTTVAGTTLETIAASKQKNRGASFIIGTRLAF